MCCTHLLRPLTAAAIVAALVGCSDIDDERTQAVLAQLRQAEQTWNAAGVRDYTIIMERTCGDCGGLVASEVRIEVVNSVVTGQFLVSDGTAIPDFARPSYPNVEGLYDVIRQAVTKDWRGLSIHYDEELGYPTVIFIDFDRTRTADNLSITVTSFTEN